jgi:hypothetical protein
MGYAVAISAAAASALILLATGPAAGQSRAVQAADPEANAGAKLAAAMSSARVRVTTPAAAQQAFIDQYCSDCHNGVDYAGGLDLGAPSTTNVGADAAIW